MRLIRLLVVATTALSLVAGTALAGGISSGAPYELSVSIGGNTFTLGDLTTVYVPTGDGSGGTHSLVGSAVTEFGTVSDWDSTYDIDPQVSNNFTVVNTTLLPQIFTISVTSPIAAVLPTSLMRGSIGITLTDEGPLDPFTEDTDGVASLTSTLATATYRAFLDGAPVQSLFPDPYTLSCSDFNCSDSDSSNFGIPVRIAGPGAVSTMGITVQFQLSAGDSASVTSVFNIIAVPEPSTAAALALGLVGLAILRRRPSA